nr:tyrosine-type recombinase/integrase [Acetobacter orientalis]
MTLRWRDIDFDRHALSLGKTKTMHCTIERDPEIRPLTPGAARLLLFLQAQRKSARPGDLVFDIGSKDAFSVRFGRMTKKAGLKDLTFHDLRHEAISRLTQISSSCTGTINRTRNILPPKPSHMKNVTFPIKNSAWVRLSEMTA